MRQSEAERERESERARERERERESKRARERGREGGREGGEGGRSREGGNCCSFCWVGACGELLSNILGDNLL